MLLGGENDSKQSDEFKATGVSLCPGIHIYFINIYSLTALPFSGMNGHPEFSNYVSFLYYARLNLITLRAVSQPSPMSAAVPGASRLRG